jgi:hypothetical protein
MPGNEKKPVDAGAAARPEGGSAAINNAGAEAHSQPSKRQRSDRDDSSDSGSDSSGDDSPMSPGTTTTTKGDPGVRLSLRKEKKSAREKARRQRENALFDELANICNVPPDMRDKSSVLRAVIKRVEELKTKGGSNGLTASSLLSALSNLSPSSSFSSLNGSALDMKSPPASAVAQPMFDDMLYGGAARAGWGAPPPNGFAVYSQPTPGSNSGSYALQTPNFGGFARPMTAMGPPPVTSAYMAGPQLPMSAPSHFPKQMQAPPGPPMSFMPFGGKIPGLEHTMQPQQHLAGSSSASGMAHMPGMVQASASSAPGGASKMGDSFEMPPPFNMA